MILCMHSALIGGELQKLLLETAYDMQMTDGSLVFVPFDTLLYSLPYRNVSYPALKRNSKLLRAYDAVLTVTIDSPGVSFYEAYREAMDNREVAWTMKPQEVTCETSLYIILAPPAKSLNIIRSFALQVSPLFGTIYNAIFFVAHTVQRVQQSRQWLSGGNLARHMHNLDFQVWVKLCFTHSICKIIYTMQIIYAMWY